MGKLSTMIKYGPLIYKGYKEIKKRRATSR